MADAPSARDLFEAGKREALIGPTRFDPAVVDLDGSDINVILRVAAAMGEEVSRFVVVSLTALAIGTARGDDLDRLVYDLYGMLRQESSPAVATLSLARAGLVGFTVPAESTFATEDGETFRTLQDVVFPAGVLGPFLVPATNVRTGPKGNVPAGSIYRVLRPQADTSLTCTNPEPAAGGGDQETDDALRDRARQFFTTARRGTMAAIEFGAREVPGVQEATAIELITPDTQLPGYRVALHVADANGQANSALAERVRVNLQEYRALGVPALVVAAIPQYVDVRATGLQFVAGYNTGSVLQQARQAVLGVVNGTGPGLPLRRNNILTALGGVAGLIVPAGALVEPAGDVVPVAGTIIRTTSERVILA